jgi:hypothetical protein
MSPFAPAPNSDEFESPGANNESPPIEEALRFAQEEHSRPVSTGPGYLPRFGPAKTILTESLDLLTDFVVLTSMCKRFIMSFGLSILTERAEELPLIDARGIEGEGLTPLRMRSV